MQYEVEQKFPVDDLDAVLRKLAALDAQISEPHREADLYYAHPVRDFAETDEGLRIRRIDQTNCITYKGPKLDPVTKTRREIELALASGDDGASQWGELLEVLGFKPVAQVCKQRRKAVVPWQGRQVVASLDDVDQVGTFVELELIAEDENGLESAKACIASLAAELGLEESERRGYLEMILKGRGK